MKTIALTRGMFALVDDEDFDRVARYKWTYHSHRKGQYARGKFNIDGRKQTVQLHRFILAGCLTPHIDHKDGNGLNNQKMNLRPCSAMENCRNSKTRAHSSQFKGVSRKRDRWSSDIRIEKKLKHLGCFINEEDAANAYDKAAEMYFGEFARTNKQMGAL